MLFNSYIDRMGGGGNRKKRKQKKVSAQGKPFVSVCTPTYNRRKFIPQLIECYKQQTYPKQLMEWIVVDDGEDSVEDLFKDVEGVKYFRVDQKMKLGRKVLVLCQNKVSSLQSTHIPTLQTETKFDVPIRIRLNKASSTVNTNISIWSMEAREGFHSMITRMVG